jgi:hypothetical protein
VADVFVRKILKTVKVADRDADSEVVVRKNIEATE